MTSGAFLSHIFAGGISPDLIIIERVFKAGAGPWTRIFPPLATTNLTGKLTEIFGTYVGTPNAKVPSQTIVRLNRPAFLQYKLILTTKFVLYK